MSPPLPIVAPHRLNSMFMPQPSHVRDGNLVPRQQDRHGVGTLYDYVIYKCDPMIEQEEIFIFSFACVQTW